MRSWLVLLRVAAILLLAVSALQADEPVAAQTGDDWSRLSQVRVGKKVAVKTKDGQTHKGKFVAWSEEAISLRDGQDEVGYRREEIHTVFHLGRSRIKGALVGLGIGLPTGVLVGMAMVAHQWRNNQADPNSIGEVFEDIGIVLGGILGGAAGLGVGTGVGAAVGWPSKKPLYRAPPPESVASSTAPSCILLPAPLTDACRVFSTEQAAREAARELAVASR